MILSDVSVKRPVFAAVISLLLIVFGLVSFGRLPLREYPDIDPPVVTIETIYPRCLRQCSGDTHHRAHRSAIAGVEGIRFIASTSEDGASYGDGRIRYRKGCRRGGQRCPGPGILYFG
jgi:multidrug efflux pump